MSRKPDFLHVVSLRTSDVLDEIGVNERMTSKRRRMYLLRESMSTVTSKILDEDLSWYHFGSQTEGTTTESLHSDEDSLVCNHVFNVIQELSQREAGKVNVQIIQNETITPGYCLLEILDGRAPGPANFDDEYSQFDSFVKCNDTGGVLMMNSIASEGMSRKRRREGPSLARDENEGFVDEDSVGGKRCKQWPLAASHWTDIKGAGKWPTRELQIAAEKSGCFVVAVGGKSGENDLAEWRISTSLAERILMFSLNITQLSCYILMKMILKVFIHPKFGKVLTSFMCKTVLFYCVRNTEPDCWKAWNILPCLVYCLQTLWHFVRSNTCPHFTIPENNLLRGKLSFEVKCSLGFVIHNILSSGGRFLTQITNDDFGRRLQEKLTPLYHHIGSTIIAGNGRILSSEYIILNAAGVLSRNYALILTRICQSNQDEQLTIFELLSSLDTFYRGLDCTAFQKVGSDLISYFLFSTIGSILASIGLSKNNQLPEKALDWLAAGEKCDASSGKLKIASALYASGDVKGALDALLNIEKQIDIDAIESMCACYDYPTLDIKPGFKSVCHDLQEDAFKSMTAFCVRYLHSELHCIPKELQYEMYRTKSEDTHSTGDNFVWMDWAVVDSLPFMYFLQFKAYQQLGMWDNRDLALAMLAMVIEAEHNLGHKETAMNLLGLSLLQVKKYYESLYCFIRSLKTRPTDNAAKIHICTLLAKMIRIARR